MPVDFADDDYITWTADPIDNLDRKTVMFWIIFDAFHASGSPNITIEKSTEWVTSGWSFHYYGHGDDQLLKYLHEWSVSRGNWEADVVFNTGTLYHLAVSYDRTNVANDPVFYVNGVLTAMTNEILTPAGIVENDSAMNLHIGAVADSIDGKKSNLLIYDRILSTAEILEHYNSKKFVTNFEGLVFWAPLCAASGLQVF